MSILLLHRCTDLVIQSAVDLTLLWNTTKFLTLLTLCYVVLHPYLFKYSTFTRNFILTPPLRRLPLHPYSNYPLHLIAGNMCSGNRTKVIAVVSCVVIAAVVIAVILMRAAGVLYIFLRFFPTHSSLLFMAHYSLFVFNVDWKSWMLIMDSILTYLPRYNRHIVLTSLSLALTDILLTSLQAEAAAVAVPLLPHTYYTYIYPLLQQRYYTYIFPSRTQTYYTNISPLLKQAYYTYVSLLI